MTIIKIQNPQYRNKSEGRNTHYSFDWQGGGYNSVWARDKQDAIFIANTWFGSDTNLSVLEHSVKEITDEKAYQTSLPLWD